MSLRENAARMANGGPAAAPAPAPVPAAAPPVPAGPLPEVNISEPGPDGPDQVPVHVAWSRVMGEVRSIHKGGEGGQVKAGGAGTYDFRGVDRTLNAFGPACRLHGVLVLPVRVETSYRDTRTSGNKPARECTVTVTYQIIGPAGDFIEVQSAGESLDSGDKGTAKALAVALRTLLLHGGLVPTSDPDPDMSQHERGEAPVRPATDYRDEAISPATSLQRLYQMHREVTQHRIAGQTVMNEHGDDEPIGDLIRRIGTERREGAQ
ncbi:ERF family protein [Actinomadura hibisca]|uniref:ERF family protein n=1 Tax=Actinomadura hibisca TaxID=68565 RepID=UPI000A3DCEFB|nr:ERF family protein [Actinomadura hibisca]